MTRWRKQIYIHQFTYDYDIPDEEAAKRIVETLEKDEEFVLAEDGELLEELRDAAEAEDLDWFDEVMDRVYDFADAHRIWLG